MVKDNNSIPGEWELIKNKAFKNFFICLFRISLWRIYFWGKSASQSGSSGAKQFLLLFERKMGISFVLDSFHTVMFVKTVSSFGGHCLLVQSLVNGWPIFSNSNDFLKSLLFLMEFPSLTCCLSCSFRGIILPFAYSTLNHNLFISAIVLNNLSTVAQADVSFCKHNSLFLAFCCASLLWRHYQLTVF